MEKKNVAIRVQDRAVESVLLGLLLNLAVCSSSFAGSLTGDVFVLGKDSSLQNHVWRFDLDGTYLGNIAPNNSYRDIVIPGDGHLYGVDKYTGDLTRMAFDGSGKTPIDISPNPTAVMGDEVDSAHPDGEGGILITPAGYSHESRTLVRYSTSGTHLASYTGMEHSGGIAADIEAGKVFSVGSSAWDDALYSFPGSGGARTTINPTTNGGYDMAIDRENDILFLGYTSTSVEKYNYAGDFLGTLYVGQPSFTLEYDDVSGYLFSGSYVAGARAVDMSGDLVHTYSSAPDMYRVSGIAAHIVPEPGTIWLLAMGMGSLAATGRRRR